MAPSILQVGQSCCRTGRNWGNWGQHPEPGAACGVRDPAPSFPACPSAPLAFSLRRINEKEQKDPNPLGAWREEKMCIFVSWLENGILPKSDKFSHTKNK